MKNLVTFIILLFVSFVTNAQNTTFPQPKVRYHTGFFNVKWELGDKDVEKTDIQLHLDKNDPEAGAMFKKAASLEKQSVLFTILSSASLIVGLATDDQASIAGYVGCGFFAIAGLGTSMASSNKYEKAIEHYNRKFGY